MDSSNRALENACKVMDGMADKIFLVKTIKDGARAIFKQVREGNLLHIAWAQQYRNYCFCLPLPFLLV